MDFSQEELFEAIDRLIAGLLERAGVERPPVDALALAENHLGIPVRFKDPEDEEPRGRHRGLGIVLSDDMTHEQQQTVAAQGIARSLIPDLFRKMGMDEEVENKPLTSHLRGLMSARLLVPTRLLRSALRTCKYDLPALHAQFTTASPEAIALRMLDLDQPCAISILDDGEVTTRRGNGISVSRKLTPPEQSCLERVMAENRAQMVRSEGWTVWGWPIEGRRFRRVVLRAVPDEV